MERIEDVLQRIQNIIKGNHPKSNIDVDLMLDYTRVLYADLLEWKSSFPIPKEKEMLPSEDQKESEEIAAEESSVSETVRNTEIKVENDDDEMQNSESSDFESNDKEDEELEKTSNEKDGSSKPDEEVQTSESSDFESDEKEDEELKGTSNEDNSSSEPNEEIKQVNEERNKEMKDVSRDKNEGKEADPHSEVKSEKIAMVDPEEYAEKPNYDSVEKPSVAEHTPEDFIYRDRTILSFELPKDDCYDEEPPQKDLKSEPEPDHSQEIKAAEEPSPSDQAIDNKNEDKSASKLPEFEFKEAPVSFIPKQKTNLDIRRVIGLNDRYLFLNELFQQNKPRYEESLDQFNEMDSFEKAVSLAEDLGKQYHWRKDDETVQSFYTILSKHFDAK